MGLNVAVPPPGNPQGRYLLLVSDIYYPHGWDDYAGRYDTVEEARQTWDSREDRTLKMYWIVDLGTNEEVETGYSEDTE